MAEAATAKPKFNNSLHGLRGVASLMVFLAHIIYGLFSNFYQDNAALMAFADYFANVGMFGVEIFFLISGYVITQSCLKYGPSEFAGRRLLRIYPLFAFVTILYFVVASVTTFDDGRATVPGLISNLLFVNLFFQTVPLSPNAWSLTFEVIYYFSSFFLIYAIAKPSKYRIVYFFLGLFASIYMLAAYGITAYYVIGVALFFLMRGKMGEAVQIKHANWLFLFCAVVIVLLAGPFRIPPTDYFEQEGWILAAFALMAVTTVAVYLTLSNQTVFARMLNNRVFKFLGDISYSLYLVHPYCYFAAKLAIGKFGLNQYDWWIVLIPYLIAITVTAMIASYIAHRTIETWLYRKVYQEQVFQRAKGA